MKRFNINPVEKEFSWGKMHVIELGEKGRGRQYVIVPYHAPEDAEYLDLAHTKNFHPKLIRSDSSGTGWIAYVKPDTWYIRGGYATVEAPEPVRVIARGQGAYGDAGRLAHWHDFLLYVPDNTLIKLKNMRTVPQYLYFSPDKVYRIEKEELELFIDVHDLAVDLNSFVDLAFVDLYRPWKVQKTEENNTVNS